MAQTVFAESFLVAGQLSGRLHFFLQEKIQFCWTVLCVIIVIVVIFAAHLSNRIKYFVRQNEIFNAGFDRQTGTFREDSANTGEPRKNKFQAHWQAELGLSHSHVPSAGLELKPLTAVR